MDDSDLVKLVLRGHMEAYSNLVDKYKNLIYDLCYRYTYNYTESQDLSQDIFWKAYRKLDTFKFTSGFSTWLYRIAVNTCIDWTRKNKKEKDIKSIDEDGVSDTIPSRGKSPEDSILDKEIQEYVRDAVLSLPEKYRTIVILYNYKDLSCNEISSILGIPVKTVETRLYRAKKMIREKLLLPSSGGEYLWNAVK